MQHHKLNQFESKIQKYCLLMPVDVLLVGGTGSGKSSTLNAIFGSHVASVGNGVEPETQNIDAYSLHKYLRIHDSAGLGDGLYADEHHAQNIRSILRRKAIVDGKNYGFIDLVLVILDGGSRDLGTAYQLLEKAVLPCISSDRIVVGINQADMAMKGLHWDKYKNSPDTILKNFLEEKAKSVQARIYQSTGISICRPVCYSAVKNYNISILIDHIIESVPITRRATD